MKGKWEVDKSGYRTKNGGLCVMNGNDCIAIVGDGNMHHPIKVNALLISKAPEMLEMIEILIDRLKENDLGDLNAVKRAEQLIKQATEL